MNVLKLSKIFFPLSMVLVPASIVAFVFWGPKLSIEFTGGTRAELTPTSQDVTIQKVQLALRSFEGDIGATAVVTQNGTILLRMRPINQETYRSLVEHIRKEAGPVEPGSFTTIGPTVGSTLKQRSLVAIAVACLGIILYIAWSFRNIPRRFSPWKFGVAAVIALLHDVIITVGIFTVLSHVTTFEMDTLFVTAILTIIGYSVNDTIIIFDRIRENLIEQSRGEDLATVTNRSFLQTLTRTFYTSFSTLIMLFALLFLGNESVFWFVLTLIVGIFIGTYSSFFVAPPLLILWQKRR